MALTIGSLVRVKETQTGHDAQYYVMGEAHELTNGATLWKTTWYLEPAPTAAELPWKLDTRQAQRAWHQHAASELM